MRSLRFVIAACVLMISVPGYAQKGKLKQATKEYDKFYYVKTTEILEEVANKGYKSKDLFEKLGNAFYYNNNMEAASKWYKELFALGDPEDPEYYFRYAQAQKYLENYELSDSLMHRFNNVKSNDLRGRHFESKVNYLEAIDAVSNDFEIYNLNINTALSDFGTTLYKDQLVFSSSNNGGEIYQWNEQPYLELYTATKQGLVVYGNVEKFNETINSQYHESSAAFSPNDSLMFFTRNNYYKKKYRKDKKGINRLKLFSARLNDDQQWGDVTSVHFNSNQYSVAHPSINSLGTKLYFASDMDSVGESDLYVVDIMEDGRLGEPVNLGIHINTESRETFPYINSKGDLFFSSDGYPGLGGLDVYVIRDFETQFAKHQQIVVENVGKPVNSPQDDFGYYENLGTREGFFTSDRPGGKGSDDIYGFKVCDQELEGIVKDKLTQEILAGATVTLFDEKGIQLKKIQIGDDAMFRFEGLDCEGEYIVRGEKEDYTSVEKRIMTPKEKQDVILQLDLEKEAVKITVNTNLRKALDLNPIYFDFDESYIRADAGIELQKIITALNLYPNMKIDVRSHTDSRGTTSYNDELSSRRNKATIQYLIDVGGISPARLSGKGYGERSLINNCLNGVPCEEAEHQKNRRSDFIVTSI